MSTVLEAELLVHLDTQINSAQRLLALVLGQGKAIRARDVDVVLAKLADVQTEMGRRGALEAALGRLQQTEESTVKQLSDTEDADIAKTLIDLNSQTAAYQAALRAGANLVQSSLMDFLR